MTAGIDLSASAVWAVDAVVAAARETGTTARLHLKVDTGLGRAGSTVAEWPELLAAARTAAAEGTVEIVGIWSHLAHADAPRHPTIDAQVRAFDDALAGGRRGRRPPAGAPPRQLRGHPGPARRALRPRPAGPGRLRAVADADRLSGRTARAPSRHDPHGTRRSRQAGPCRAGRVLPAHGTRPTARRRSRWSRWAMPTGSRGPRPTSGRCWSPAGAGRIAGTVCMDQFVVDVGDDAVVGRRRGGALRSGRQR